MKIPKWFKKLRVKKKAKLHEEHLSIVYEKGSDIVLSPHFSLNEFDCHCSECTETIVDPRLIVQLELLRIAWEEPIHVTSGYRCKYYNTKIGGAKRSQHLLGKAADIIMRRRSPSTIAYESEKYFTGIGRYKTFTHVDVRPKVARWGRN